METDAENKPIKQQIESLAADNGIECLYYPEDDAKIVNICETREKKKRYLFIDIGDMFYNDVRHLRSLMWGYAKDLDITVMASLRDLTVLTPKIQVDSLKFIISDTIGCIVLYDPDPMKLRRLTRLSVLLDD